MLCIAVRGPSCQSDQSVQRGKTRRGPPRYLCQKTACIPQSLLRESRDQGRFPAGKQQRIALRRKASGVRETARGVPRSPDTGLRARRQKDAALASVPTTLLRPMAPDESRVDMQHAGDAALDERWRVGGKQGTQRGRWPAIDHPTGAVLAYVCGRRQEEGLLPRQALLEPLGLTRVSTDHGGAYTRHLAPAVHRPGQRNTPQIERKHLTLRTRITRVVRKTIGFSKSIQMHDLVLGLFVNRYAFGLLA